MYRFEKFSRASRLSAHPMATIQKTGTLTLNRGPYEALGQTPTVELYFDPGEKVLGLRPAPPESPDAYPVRKQRNRRGYNVLLSAFCRFYGLDRSASRRYEGALVAGILVIDTRKPVAVPRPPPAPRTRPQRRQGASTGCGCRPSARAAPRRGRP